MSLVGRAAKNHPQQVERRGAQDAADERATDPVLFERLNSEHHFTLDAAARAHNAKCERFCTPSTNGLLCSWEGERVWCNPPFSNIRPWVEKAWLSSAELVVMLLPANRTEQRWWQELIEPYRDGKGLSEYPDGKGLSPNPDVDFLRGRLRFIASGKSVVGPDERPPFGCCVVTWKHPVPPDDLQVESSLPMALTQGPQEGKP